MRKRALAWSVALSATVALAAVGCRANARDRSSDSPKSTASETSEPTVATEPGADTGTDTEPEPVKVLPAVRSVGKVSHGELAFGGRDRTYRLYVPRGLPAGPVPLFIGLHGGSGWGDQFATTVNKIEGLAQSNGFIVAHPDAVKLAVGPGGVWNGGICCGVAVRENVDDVGFIEALIDRIASDHNIDPKRVFAFGHSNGAIMSYRLACELSQRIVGIGMYAGTLGVDDCDPSYPVSVIHVHGTADQSILITGGAGPESISRVDFPSPLAGFDTLATRNSCPGAEKQVSGDITTERRKPCEGNAAATFVRIESGTHGWPGSGNPDTYASYDTTFELVSFLLSHPRR